MSGRWRGIYEGKKWWSPVTVQLLTDRGFSEVLHYPRACLDTGSPYIVFPGKCASPPLDEDRPPATVPVEIAVGPGGTRTTLNLPPRGRVIGFGGVGGTRRDRYLFCADVDVEGLEYDDLVSIVFFDPSELSHPIIGLTEFVGNGGSITFGGKGFRTK